eukprot:1439720-Rhodomonas_salina.2
MTAVCGPCFSDVRPGIAGCVPALAVGGCDEVDGAARADHLGRAKCKNRSKADDGSAQDHALDVAAGSGMRC